MIHRCGFKCGRVAAKRALLAGEALGEGFQAGGAGAAQAKAEKQKGKGVWWEGQTPGVCLGRQQTMTRPQGFQNRKAEDFSALPGLKQLCLLACCALGDWLWGGGMLPSEGSQLCPFPHLHPSDRWEREAG